MPTPQQRWPNNAESNRLGAKELAEDTERLIGQAIADIKQNPDRCELRLAYAMKNLKHIQLMLTEAKVGK